MLTLLKKFDAENMSYIRIIEGPVAEFHLKSSNSPFLMPFLAVAGVFID